MPRSTLLLALACLPVLAADLAPTGTLRAVFLGDNPVQASVDRRTGAVSGPVADIVKELARRAGVSYTITPAAGAKAVIDSLNDAVSSHGADIGFLAWESERARQVDYSIPYLLMGSSYLVPSNSPIKLVTDADRAGMIVGGVAGQSPTIYLQEHLKNAKVITWPVVPAQEELKQMFADSRINAFAANRTRLIEAAAHDNSVRVAADNFTMLEQAIVVRKGDDAKLKIINQFLDEARASSFMKDSIVRAKIAGVEAAPPRKP